MAGPNSYSVRADGATARWIATHVAPWESKYHALHYTKGAGARIDMKRGEWNKSLLLAELKHHPFIFKISGGTNKLNNSAPDAHECDTNYMCL